MISKTPILQIHALIERDGELYSALCLELDVASQGETVEEAKANLQEAIELYLEEVYESGLEEEFIPRPAPMEYWLRYFANMKRKRQNGRNHKRAIIGKRGSKTACRREIDE